MVLLYGTNLPVAFVVHNLLVYSTIQHSAIVVMVYVNFCRKYETVSANG